MALLLWFIVAKDCGVDFIVRNLNTKLLYTAALYQVKSYLQMKPIKTPSHLDWGQLRVVSKVTPFLLFFNIENNGKFDIKTKINDSKIFGVSAHELQNHEIKMWSHHNTCI